MADEAIDEQESQKPDEEVQTEVLDTNPDVELDLETLQAKIDKAEEEKNKMYARAKKAEEENKKLKTLKTNEFSSNPEDIERLRLEVKGYKGDEVDFLMQNGGLKALDNDIAMAGIEAIRKKTKSTEATPSGTAKSTVYQKFTEQDLKRMSAEELEKIIPQ